MAEATAPTVDVLTLSATPIPRRLHLSLLGIRDISNLETPPPDRKAIETRILRFDEATIQRAVVRELNREGQVYFVHNRVHDIHHVADKVQSIVPARGSPWRTARWGAKPSKKPCSRFSVVNSTFSWPRRSSSRVLIFPT